MKQGGSTLRSFGLMMLLLTFVLGLTLGLTAIAQAQTSKDEEYGNQAASGLQAIEGAFASSGGSGSHHSNGSHSSHNSGGHPDATGVLSSGVLPFTGGSLLPPIALGVLALSAIGLIAVRRSNL